MRGAGVMVFHRIFPACPVCYGTVKLSAAFNYEILVCSLCFGTGISGA